MCKPEPIKVPVGQACSVSVEGLKVRVGTVGRWQNPTAFLLPVKLLSSKNCLSQRTCCLSVEVMFLPCDLLLGVCVKIRKKLSLLFFSIDQLPG